MEMAESKTILAPEMPIEGSAPIIYCTFEGFLEGVPLHSPRSIKPILFFQVGKIGFPGEIRVHCDHHKCDGIRRHLKEKENAESFLEQDKNFYHYSVYRCTNCNVSTKVFVIKSYQAGAQYYYGISTKIYQEPAFGQPIPKRLFQIIGETNREHFLQGRRAIARGLGVGAYSYYGRIVENTKFDLVGAVLEVALATNASASQIELLKKAQSETQFSKAIEMLRDVSAIPAVLLIDGHNPLSLLHDLLSEGIHQLNDTECLERTQEAEVILCEIADRMQIALTERKTVKAAITSILNRKATGEKSAAAS
jgi:hypothetical protein